MSRENSFLEINNHKICFVFYSCGNLNWWPPLHGSTDKVVVIHLTWRVIPAIYIMLNVLNQLDGYFLLVVMNASVM